MHEENRMTRPLWLIGIPDSSANDYKQIAKGIRREMATVQESGIPNVGIEKCLDSYWEEIHESYSQDKFQEEIFLNDKIFLRWDL